MTVKVLEGCLSWLSTPARSIPRASHLTSMLPSGKMLVAGGTQQSVILDNAELCDVTKLP